MQSPVPDNNLKYVSLSYFGPWCDKIAHAFKKAKIQVGFRTRKKLGRVLRHSLDVNSNKFRNSGVYKIACGSCDGIYVGQTGRDFVTRFKEHTYRSNNSALGCHLKTKGHILPPMDESLKILHIEPKGRDLDILEDLEVYAHHKSKPESVINEQIASSRQWFFNIFDDLLV